MTKLEEIKHVQSVLEKAMQAVIDYIQVDPHPTSEHAHDIIEKVLEKYGCESPEGCIVAGWNDAVDPHNKGKGLLKEGDSIVIDIYPRSKKTGYFADMTRTVCKGNARFELQKMYKDVLDAQTMAADMLKPGVDCKLIQTTIENYFFSLGYETRGKGTEFPYEEGFVHGVGHGVSTILHDHPHIGRNTNDVLKEGDIVTIEPDLYYYDLGAVRIEDMFLVTKDGTVKITNFDTKLEI